MLICRQFEVNKVARELNVIRKVLGANFSMEKKRSRLDVFDREMKRRQREITSESVDFKTYQYIREEMGERIADRVWDVKRDFEIGVELSAGTGFVAKHLNNVS